MGIPNRPIRIFVCYAREDEPLLRDLEKQLGLLRRQGFIEVWHDREISPGTNWEQAIAKYLNTADVILLLVSPDFILSDYCYGVEMQRAMERHEAGEVLVIPVIIRPVSWQSAPFGKIQALPTDAKPVTGSGWQSQEEAFYDVAEGIRKIVEKLMMEATNTLSIPVDEKEIKNAQKGTRESGLQRFAKVSNLPMKPASLHAPGGEDSILLTSAVVPTFPNPYIQGERNRQTAETHPEPIEEPQLQSQIEIPPVQQTDVLSKEASAPQTDRKTAIGTALLTYEHLCDRRHTIVWSPDRTRFASSGADGTVRIRNVLTGQTLLVIDTGKEPMYAGAEWNFAYLAWSPNGQMIAALLPISSFWGVWVWDATSGKLLHQHETYSGAAFENGAINAPIIGSGSIYDSTTIGSTSRTSVEWSPDGSLIAFVGNRETVYVWEAISGQLLQKHNIPSSVIACSLIQPRNDGWLIASTSQMEGYGDQTILVWDATSGKVCQLYDDSPVETTPSVEVAKKTEPSSPDKRNKDTGPRGWFKTSANRWITQMRKSPSTKSPQRDPEQHSSDFSVEIFHCSITVIAWSTNTDTGYLLASGGNDGTIRVWNTISGELVQLYRGHGGAVRIIAWSPDGRFIASIGAEYLERRDTGANIAYNHPRARKIMQMWEVASGRLLHSQYEGLLSESTIEWSPDGQLIASADGSLIQVWEAASGKLLYEYQGDYQGRPGWPIAWLPDGHRLLIVEMGKNEATETKRSNNVTYINKESQDGTMQVRELFSGTCKQLRHYEGHAEYITSIAWSPDGRLLASMSESGTVQVWEITSDQYKQLYHHDIVDHYGIYESNLKGSTIWWSDGLLLGCSVESKGILVWEPTSGNPLHLYEGHSGMVIRALQSPNGSLIASLDKTGNVQVWEATSGKQLHSYEGGHAEYTTSFAWSPDGQLIALGNKAGVVQVWEPTSGKLIPRYDDHFQWISSDITISEITWSPDGQLITSFDKAGIMHAWKATSGEPLYRVENQPDTYPYPVWSPNSQLIALCSYDNSHRVRSNSLHVEILDATSGKRLHSCKNYQRCLAWSPDGHLIASAEDVNNDTTMQVWEAVTGTVLFTFQRDHPTHVREIAWSPNGKYIASVARGVHIWQAP